eukprot:scaffold10310_cov81-Cylindrotheca_fusiformis.AAC.2
MSFVATSNCISPLHNNQSPHLGPPMEDWDVETSRYAKFRDHSSKTRTAHIGIAWQRLESQQKMQALVIINP